MDRFSSKEEIEETPTSIAKDIIYSDGSMDEKVKQIASAIRDERQRVLCPVFCALEISQLKIIYRKMYF